jgi:hypothetical protein
VPSEEQGRSSSGSSSTSTTHGVTAPTHRARDVTMVSTSGEVARVVLDRVLPTCPPPVGDGPPRSEALRRAQGHRRRRFSEAYGACAAGSWIGLRPARPDERRARGDADDARPRSRRGGASTWTPATGDPTFEIARSTRQASSCSRRRRSAGSRTAQGAARSAVEAIYEVPPAARGAPCDAPGTSIPARRPRRKQAGSASPPTLLEGAWGAFELASTA